MSMGGALQAAANPWLPRPAIIEQAFAETPGVATYHVRLQGPQQENAYAFECGQFNMLYLPGFGEIAISLSGPAPVSSSDGSPVWVHTIREAGSVTNALAKRGPGCAIGVRGPFGKPWPIEECHGQDVVLVAGGLGLAPLRPVVYHLLAARGKVGRVSLLYGARSPEHLLFSAEYAAWRVGGFELETTVDRAPPGWNGHVGVVSLLLDRLVPLDPARTVVFACGPEIMMRFVAKSAESRGISSDRIWLSLERHMQCAVGLCGHCQLGTELICRDGPTFSWRRIEPLMQIHDL